MELTFNSLHLNDLSEEEMSLINGGWGFPALIIFGITISPWIWVPAAIAGTTLLIDGIYVGFRETYENLKRQYS